LASCLIKSIPNYCASSLSLSLSLSLPPSAVDLLYGGIYCFVCQDYIYDKEMEQIAKEEQRKAWKLQGMCFRLKCFLPGVTKHRRPNQDPGNATPPPVVMSRCDVTHSACSPRADQIRGVGARFTSDGAVLVIPHHAWCGCERCSLTLTSPALSTSLNTIQQPGSQSCHKMKHVRP